MASEGGGIMSPPAKATLPWVRTIRRESGLVENICTHGVGHPAAGSAHFQYLIRGHEEETWDTHGCDGCCQDLTWKMLDLKEGLRIANRIIVQMMQEREKA